MLNNNQIKERELIVFGKTLTENDYMGGIIRFKITPDTALLLIDKMYLDPKETQNESPTAKTMIDWALAHHSPQNNTIVHLHGYMASHKRKDCRITLEGLDAKWQLPKVNGVLDKSIALDFCNAFHGADEFECDETHGYCWWD